jgi:copper chaperone CopZ
MGLQSPDRSADTVVLTVSGMTCGGCANAVNRVLSAVAGVTRVHVDLAGERATVIGTAPAGELIRAVEIAGFGARLT